MANSKSKLAIFQPDVISSEARNLIDDIIQSADHKISPCGRNDKKGKGGVRNKSAERLARNRYAPCAMRSEATAQQKTCLFGWELIGKGSLIRSDEVMKAWSDGVLE